MQSSIIIDIQSFMILRLQDNSLH